MIISALPRQDVEATVRAALINGYVMVTRGGGTTLGPSLSTTQRSSSFNAAVWGKRLAV